MKQLISLSILAISITTFATTPLRQYAEKPDDAMRCDSIVDYSDDGKKKNKTEFIYNEQGNITSEVRYWRSDGAWTQDSKTDYTLDEKGYCTGQKQQDLYEQYNQIPEGEECIIDSTILFADDSLMNEDISDIEFEEDETPVDKTEFDTICDEQGRICNIIVNNPSKKKSKIDLSYDEQGNISNIYGYTWTNNEWVNDGKMEYAYNEQGKLTEFNVHTLTDGVWVNECKRERTYDARGNETSDIIYTLQDGKLVPYEKNDRTYDEQGNMISDISYWYEDGKLVPFSKKEYIYNELGQRTNENNYFSEKGEWDLNAKTEYTYDDQGNLDSCIKYSTPDHVCSGSEIDEDGNLVTKEYSWAGRIEHAYTRHFYYSKHTIAASEIPFVAGTKYDPYMNHVKTTHVKSIQNLLNIF